MTALNLQQRARRRLANLQRRKREPRYLRVMGRFLQAGLLVTNTGNADVVRNRAPLHVQDVLWAGELEPRLLELLPALLVKQPSMFAKPQELPPDLVQAVEALKRDLVPADFRGIPGGDVHRWLREVGRLGKVPSRLKSFRFKSEDQRLLTQLAEKLGLSETDVIRKALRALV